MTDLKHTAREIFLRTLAAIDIPATMRRKLARSGTLIHCGEAAINLADFDRVVAIAIGKAGCAMTRGLLDVLAPDFPVGGILAVPAPPPQPLPGFEVFIAGHPVPNEASLAAGAAALHLLSECDENSLVFFLLSGGGSALFEQPIEPGIYLEDMQELNRALVTCGAPIEQINVVRKHLSAVKGGRLAVAAPHSLKVTLAVTDVPEGRESALASGPTLPDPSTVEDACDVIERFHLLERLPAPLRALIENRQLRETPKPGHPAFARSQFHLLLGMHDLFHAAHQAAQAAGCFTICDNSTDDWPIERAAAFLLRQLEELKRQHPGRRVCVLADGEVSSPVTGSGLGGRNSAFVLHCVEKIAGQPVAVLSAGTDGADGNSPAAGAVADGQSLARARAAGLDPGDYFRRSDAYSFFAALGDAVETGPTGNNLRDLRVLLAE
jgi:hydroxypyruvate reductase